MTGINGELCEEGCLERGKEPVNLELSKFHSYIKSLEAFALFLSFSYYPFHGVFMLMR